MVVCGLTCLLGRATSLTVPIPPSPPAGTAAPDASASMQEQLDALRAQLAGTEAALATANDQLLARHNLAALDLAGTPAAPPTHDGLYPPAGQGATDGPLAAGHAAAAGAGAGAPADLPLAPAAGAHDGAHDDDFLTTYDDEGASSGGGEWAPAPFNPHGVHTRPCAAGSGGHRGGADLTVDNFDRATRPTAGGFLRSFTIPHDVRRADGLPVPFKPVDNVHATDFAAGSRDVHEARQWYHLLAWVQQLHNDSLRVQHSADLTVQQYAAFTDYVSVGSRRIFAIGAARYDYLAMRQTELSLAEAYAHADAILRNGRRDEGARRFLAGVFRQEAYASAKLGALERGFSYGGGRAGRGGNGGADGANAGQPRKAGGGVGGRPAAGGRGGGGADRGGRGRGRGRA